jgi:putative ABC transport system permease protein
MSASPFNRLARSVRTFLAIFVVAARRLWAGRGLALAGAFGLMAVVAFTLSIPLYTDAVYHTILEKEIAKQGTRRKPPFAFLYRYVGRSSVNEGRDEWENVPAADDLLINRTPATLGLPRESLVRYFATDSFPIFPATGGDSSGAATYDSQRQPLAYLSLGAMSALGEHARLVEGRLPEPSASPDAPVEVLVSQGTANKLGLQPGEKYVVFANKIESKRAQALAVVTGIWAAADPSEAYWYDDPQTFDTILFTAEETFFGSVAPTLRGQTSIAVWYMVFDGRGVRSDGVAGLLERIQLSVAEADLSLPGIRLEVSPEFGLKRYQETSQTLTLQLLAFSAPLLLLLFAFITLVAGLMASGRRNEVAVLRSRGAAVSQVLGISFLEAAWLAAIALLAGVPAGESIARVIGLTRSFLTFDFTGALPVMTTLGTLRIGLIVTGLAAIVIVLPVVGSARHTIITYKQERARELRPPWWQRAWLDVLLLIPAAYGTYILRQQGTLALPGALTTTSSEDPFGNPLLFLVPAFAMVALTLFLIRLMPALLRALAWVLGRLPGTALVLATRQLARSPSFYAAPLLLLVLTLSLASFTASLAATLDQHLQDRTRYTIGGDMSLIEAEMQTGPAKLPGQETAEERAAAEEKAAADAAAGIPPPQARMFVPMSDYISVQGVRDATRVGFYKATARFSGGNVTGQLAGLDRTDFARIAFWRRDFASTSLGALMNALATSTDAVLLPQKVMEEQALNVGDRVRIVITLEEGSANLDLRVVGAFKLWPGWFPDPDNARVKSMFVGNLDYISEQVGMQLPYRVWLRLDPGADPGQVIEGVSRLGVGIQRADYVGKSIDFEQARPERQGLFGVLSVGFAAAALMTVLGFFLYAVFSLRRRLIELGILRAVGLGARQMAAFLAWELALLLGTGVGVGTLLGVASSQVYIPFMQVGLSAEARTVPFRVILPWEAITDIYALFGLLFVAVLGMLVAFVLRMKVFQAVKLGETE